MACRDKEKFATSEASSKASLRTKGAIDEFLNILNTGLFRKLNKEWTNYAKEKFGIKENLFFEENDKAIPNTKVFTEIDKIKGIQYNTEEVPASTTSPELLKKVKEVVAKMGVKIETLADYVKGNPDVDTKGVNGLADLVKGIIAIAENKEGVSLTEEMVHIATAMLEQTNPKLVTEMISKIGKFKIYNEVLREYSKNPAYQTKDGKPDIRKIKKEAVDKLIVEVIIKQSEGSTEFPELLEEANKTLVTTWWQKILNFFKQLYEDSSLDIFEEAASKIISGDIGAKYYEPGEGILDINDRIVFGHPGIGKTFLRENRDDFIDVDNDYKEQHSKQKELHAKWKESGLQEDKETWENYVANWWAEVKQDAEENDKKIFVSNLPILRMFPEDFDKVITMSEADFKNRSIQRGDYNEGDTENWKKNLDAAISGVDQSIVRTTDKYLSDIIEPEFKGEGIFFQISDKQKEIQQRILNTQQTLEKREDKISPVDPMFLDTEEASNYYVVINPDGSETKVLKRVTDRVKAWYKQRFGDKKFTEAEKEFNELKRQTGTEYHHLFELVHGRYFNDDGSRKKSVAPRHRMASVTEGEVYGKIEKYYVELIESFSQGKNSPLVFSEVKMYDPKAKEAGTIDLLIVEENGKAHIFDWKFMTVSEQANDIPWYKQGAYNVQLGRYKEMLRDVYGVKEFGMMRAIPILMDFKTSQKKLRIAGITIGSVDVNKIEDLKLVPVSEETESTGNEKLDKLIVQLNSVYRQVGKVVAATEEQKEFKRERLNILKEAIRAAQSSNNVEPLVTVIKVMSREGEQIINDWETLYSKKAASSDDVTNKELSDYADSIREYISIANIFVDVDKMLSDLIYTPEMEVGKKTKRELMELAERKKLAREINEEAKAIFSSKDTVKEIGNKFADKFMGQRNLVTGLLKPEAIWSSLSSMFRGAVDSPLKSILILTKLTDNARGRAVKDSTKEIDELMSIREKLAKRGGDFRELVQKIYQKDDKSKLVNKLIYKFKKEFYDAVQDNSLEGAQSKKWILENINVDEYKKEALDILTKKIARIKSIYQDNEEMMIDLITKERDKWDISRKTFNGWNNYIIKRHPKDIWLSDDYLELQKDNDLMDLYNFISKVNTKAADIGYIQNKIHSTFIPFVRKSLAESLAWDFSLSAVTQLGDNLSLRAGDIGYGSVNELTKEIEHSIPKYYTHDFSLQEDGKHDYSEVSEDIFKNMILYINHMHNYKYLSEVEGQVQLVKTIETFKNHLRTSFVGNIVMEGGKPQEEGGNEKNAKMFDEFMRAVFYEEKYPLSSGDTPINIDVTNFIKKAINKVAGKEVYTVDENPDAKSLIKTIDAANRAFQLKTLGFEFISGAVNWFGNNIQIATQSGNYFKAREILSNEGKLLGNKFKNDEEREMFIQLINTFLPLKDDPSYDAMKEAGMTELTKHNFADMLMWFMREPENHMQKTIFLTLLDNTMVVDGKLVNIREYVNNKYSDRYSSAQTYADASKNIEKEIEELKKTSSISAIKTLEDGKLVIPGFDLDNFNETNRLSTLAKRISRNATGSMTQTDINKMNMNVWTKSMMVFKGWIPKLVDTRFGEFRKISDDFSVQIDDDGLTTGEKYDIGRIRLFASFLHFNIIRTITEINDILSVNENGLVKLDELFLKYSEVYKKQTGEDLTMTKAEFADLIRNNLRNQVKELSVLFSLLGLMTSMGYFEPDDDKDKAANNFHRFSLKVIDKFVGELSFFYNPVEIEKILSGSAFPALGLFSDASRFTKHLALQTTGFDWGNTELTQEQVRKKAQPIKYLGKMLPITKSFITYGAIMSDEFAREYDVTIQKNNNR